MNIAIPAVPAGIAIIVNFFAPYLVSLLVAATWTAKTKQLVAAGLSVLLTALALLIAHYGFGVPIGANAWQAVLLGFVVMFFSYDLLHKQLADQLTAKAGVGTQKAALDPAPVETAAPTFQGLVTLTSPDDAPAIPISSIAPVIAAKKAPARTRKAATPSGS